MPDTTTIEEADQLHRNKKNSGMMKEALEKGNSSGAEDSSETDSEEENPEDAMEILEISQMQREALRRCRKEERAIPSILHCPHPIAPFTPHITFIEFHSLSTSYFFSLPLPPPLASHEPPPPLASHEAPPLPLSSRCSLRRIAPFIAIVAELSPPLSSRLLPSSPSSQSSLRRYSNPNTIFVILLLGGA
ncbi:uncharacterized protein DS421_5g151070 [Arachis hypogaea]|nr:uncharacterized protein DS421_5g151070 [Arachis hypogaea]